MQRILIANRGEIAVRIIRACADDGRTSIAVYADPDADALHVRLADEAYALDGSTGAETYLDIAKIIAVARRARADAIHPGYGFLSENAAFARAVLAAGMTWIGPSPECIKLLGDKVAARALAAEVGAPLAAGSDGPVDSAAEVRSFAERHGLPVAIKAAHGGGGRGLRVARSLGEIEERYAAAVSEARQAFGRGECFVERYLEDPRHVEVQVLADRAGTVIAVGTRDCSLQRRNQKLVEEAPAPQLSEDQRRQLTEAAVAICRAAGYVGAGTVEFLLAADGTISFLEVNTRLQVEHPVTEETADVDLVHWQFRIAEGAGLDSGLADRRPRGHAIEFRINAEDSGRGFLPAPGTIERFAPPSGPGVRLDPGVADGSAVPGQFDSLIAKLIVWGPDRATALARARRALAEFEIVGVPTVLPFHRAVVDDPAFAGDFGVHTRWIETVFAERIEPAAAGIEPAAGLQRSWIEVDGRRVRLGLPAGLAAGGVGFAEAGTAAPEEPAPGALLATAPGTLARWLVADGERVEAGTPVAVVEAMKMESELTAPCAGVLRQTATEGQAVAADEQLGLVEG